MHILKEVCYMTTSFPAINFFYDSVLISPEPLKQCTCQGNCVYFTTIFATIIIISAGWFEKKLKNLLTWGKHRSSALLNFHIYPTELVTKRVNSLPENCAPRKITPLPRKIASQQIIPSASRLGLWFDSGLG